MTALYKAHFSSGAILVIIAESMTAAKIKADYYADTIRTLAKRDIGHVVRVELDLDGEEVA
jgi:hypothetical protein